MKSTNERYPNLGRFYDQVTGDEDARVCKDIPEAACRHLPRNFFAYLFSNFFSKVADELVSARLILPWLMGVLGAPAGFVGFLVPIREAGVLIPQLMVAAYIRRMAKRKGVWIVGASLSAIALLIMAMVAGALEGAAAGWAILGLVTLFSLARGLCSVSAKDVLGKTVSKTRRGALMGYSAAMAGVATVAIGIWVEFQGRYGLGIEFFMGLLFAAAALWLIAIVLFGQIVEAPGSTEGGGNAIAEALRSLALLKTDPAFRHFVISRALLLSAALAPPFYVLLTQQSSGGESGLGLLIIASGVAGSLSAPVWGRMADRSSRLVMVMASLVAGVVGLATWALDSVGAPFMDNVWVHATLFLLIAVAHSGVRLGRKVYLVDMATQKTRSAYVAVSNTVIGVAMLAGGAIGVLADLFQPSAVIALLGGISLFAALYIARMPEVSG
jgi:hypothetical protein